MRRKLLAVVLLALTGACSEPDISQEVEDYADALGDAEALACQCPAALGFDNVADCGAAFGIVGSERQSCMTEALRGEEDPQAFVACASDAAREYSACLMSSIDDGCEQSQHLSCVDAFEDAALQCPGASSAAAADFLTCEND
ncbi:hypothetical protein PPSIR1_39140 [Plesiocystis pacifica SIR-1]|uniref:Lipoprotein n=1 Tax=Plesiocystis pacifica SIR-1 TaxID=391625 RepID=A6GJ01_9BACT|nr:hypothetical protein [Plesiocystis pacifica]EDM74157.1 hypothetical protein PPSIR1_39140 [Plesiocystis pacifica SIR-1]